MLAAISIFLHFSVEAVDELSSLHRMMNAGGLSSPNSRNLLDRELNVVHVPIQDLTSSMVVKENKTTAALTPGSRDAVGKHKKKSVNVLGRPSTNKCTLVSALLQKPPSDAGKDEPRTDFALGYDCSSIHPRAAFPAATIHSSSHCHCDHIGPDTAVTFPRVETRLSWIEHWVKGYGARELEAQEHSHTPPPAYPMGGRAKGKGSEWEERIDGTMQISRVICLKYGASLFYTTPQPTTLNVMRQYALHVLFVPPAASPDGVMDSTATPKEGSSTGTTLGLGRHTGAPTSPVLGSAPNPMQHRVLQKFFKDLLNPKDRAASPGTSVVCPGAATTTGKPTATGPRTSSGSAGGGASGSVDSQSDPDPGRMGMIVSGAYYSRIVIHSESLYMMTALRTICTLTCLIPHHNDNPSRIQYNWGVFVSD
ncbi:hypothetical protein EI94DRAFT_1700281 [Lactarius quietus]|nr:hypothetical protein EI94DRAFT_1700281 [Lactarius quietus]